MAIFDNLANKAGDTIRAGEWVSQGRDKLITQVIPKLPAELQPGALSVSNRLVQGKSSIGRVSSSTFLAIVSYFGVGLESEARLLFLATVATNAQRQDALKAAARNAYGGHEADEAAWAEVKVVALGILKDAGQAAIPLLLAMAL